jgi:Predicted pyridoxal phosphate-dependent enzyme apparently involved in regulation of cell wall biogenesis
MTQIRKIPFGRPWIGDEERQAVLEVLNGDILAHGPRGKAFEEDFAAFLGQGAHCVSMSSCMAALHMAYFSRGIGSGDEVVVPALTHVATAHAVAAVGATPVFADADPLTGNITAEAMARAITPRTKALTLVHYLGIPCEMDAIMDLAKTHGLYVVEDCALAVGTRYKGVHAGLWGDVGCFSFYPVKHITTAEGGMLSCRDADMATRIARKRAFGVDRTYAERKVPGYYDVVELGFNYRMSELHAALGRAQMLRLPEILRRRAENFALLKAGLAGVDETRVLDSQSAEAENSHYCLSLVLSGRLAPRRNELIAALNAAGIGCSIYYPQPVPRMSHYRSLAPYSPKDFPVAEQISDGSIALPVGPHLGAEDMNYIAEHVCKTLRSYL